MSLSCPHLTEFVFLSAQWIGRRYRKTVLLICYTFSASAVAELSEDSSSELLALSDHMKHQARHSFARMLLFDDLPTVF